MADEINGISMDKADGTFRDLGQESESYPFRDNLPRIVFTLTPNPDPGASPDTFRVNMQTYFIKDPMQIWDALRTVEPGLIIAAIQDARAQGVREERATQAIERQKAVNKPRLIIPGMDYRDNKRRR